MYMYSCVQYSNKLKGEDYVARCRVLSPSGCGGKFTQLKAHLFYHPSKCGISPLQLGRASCSPAACFKHPTKNFKTREQG